MGESLIRLALPRLGETMEEARVTLWLKAPGEAFRRGEVLLEVETDKTVVEVPAMQDGHLVAQLVEPGETVGLGQDFAEVRVEGAAAAEPRAEAAEVTAVTAPAPVLPMNVPPDRVAASTRARRLARAAGIALSDLAGTGRHGRVTAADVSASRGDLAPVLLLHGLFDEARGWRDLPERLARAGHRVLAPDLPGHGTSEQDAADPEAAVEILARWLAQEVPDGPLRLVGHSLGAVLATRLALLLGQRVERLVLIAPVGLGARLGGDFVDIVLNADTTAALGRALSLLGGGPVSDTALRSELARIGALRDRVAPLARALVRGDIQQVDIAPDLARIAVPVAAMFGLSDRIVDWRDCAALPARAAIHLVRDAGHLPHLAAPDLVQELISGPAGLVARAAPGCALLRADKGG